MKWLIWVVGSMPMHWWLTGHRRQSTSLPPEFQLLWICIRIIICGRETMLKKNRQTAIPNSNINVFVGRSVGHAVRLFCVTWTIRVDNQIKGIRSCEISREQFWIFIYWYLNGVHMYICGMWCKRGWKMGAFKRKQFRKQLGSLLLELIHSHTQLSHFQ